MRIPTWRADDSRVDQKTHHIHRTVKIDSVTEHQGSVSPDRKTPRTLAALAHGLREAIQGQREERALEDLSNCFDILRISVRL